MKKEILGEGQSRPSREGGPQSGGRVRRGDSLTQPPPALQATSLFKSTPPASLSTPSLYLKINPSALTSFGHLPFQGRQGVEKIE